MSSTWQGSMYPDAGRDGHRPTKLVARTWYVSKTDFRNYSQTLVTARHLICTLSRGCGKP